ncbi:MAG: hypothetical protein FWG89_10015 [Treponema sp.]|nr:hypothetical protein [Treponema sp.]
MNESQKQEITGFFTGKDASAFKGVVFLFNNIPEKKLQNAIKHYAHLKSGEEVVLLYEYSAKEGFVLTTSSLYVNQPTYADCSVGESAAISDINDFSWRKGKGLMNPEEYIDINAGSQTVTIQYMYGKQLMSALEKTVSVLKSSGLAGDAIAAAQPVTQETAASPGLKHEYEQGQKEGEEFADKLLDVADKAKNALGKLGGLFGKK